MVKKSVGCIGAVLVRVLLRSRGALIRKLSSFARMMCKPSRENIMDVAQTVIRTTGVPQFAVGFATIGVACASQNLATNFVAGLLMLLFHPLKCGDLVRIGGVEGRVASVGYHNTTLVTENTEEEVQFANSSIVSGAVIRLDGHRLRDEVATVTLAPGSDPEVVKCALTKAMAETDLRLAPQFEEMGIPDPMDPARSRRCFMSDLGRSGEQTWNVAMHLPHDPHCTCVSTLLECIAVEIGRSDLEHATSISLCSIDSG